jgi:FAD/FMN-containing dehydrogenase
MSVLNTLQTIMPKGISRREFLRRAGSVGVGLFGASTIARLPWDTAEAASVANAADYADLAAQLTGSLVLPTDASYATARLVWNTLYDNRYPQAVVKAATPQDVQVAINFARDMGLQPIARAGGHSFQGYSTGSGLVIDVAGLNDVTMNAGRTRARIGAGTNLLRIYGVLAQRGMAIPGGSCPTVGISGLTQGGGIGPFTRQPHPRPLDRCPDSHG